MVEHFLEAEGVAGSSPVLGTSKVKTRISSGSLLYLFRKGLERRKESVWGTDS